MIAPDLVVEIAGGVRSYKRKSGKSTCPKWMFEGSTFEYRGRARYSMSIRVFGRSFECRGWRTSITVPRE